MCDIYNDSRVRFEKTDVRKQYDAGADVLYVSFGAPIPAYGLEIGNGIVLRLNPVTDELAGITIVDYSKVGNKRFKG